MAIKRHRLDLAIQEDFCLLGVVCDEIDYRFCWLLNRKLDADFRREENLDLFHAKLNKKQSFSIFSHNDKTSMLTYRIIGNRSSEGWYIEELKHLDYLVHIQGDIFQEDMQEFIGKVSGVAGVRMCVPVDLQRLKNKERLYLW